MSEFSSEKEDNKSMANSWSPKKRPSYDSISSDTRRLLHKMISKDKFNIY